MYERAFIQPTKVVGDYVSEEDDDRGSRNSRAESNTRRSSPVLMFHRQASLNYLLVRGEYSISPLRAIRDALYMRSAHRRYKLLAPHRTECHILLLSLFRRPRSTLIGSGRYWNHCRCLIQLINSLASQDSLFTLLEHHEHHHRS